MSGVNESLRIVVLGASGATGSRLVDGALARGFDVHAIARDPAGFAHDPDPLLTVHRGDVTDADTIAAAITRESVVVSGLGVRSKREAGVLTAGALAVLHARPAAVIWLGAVGTGRSAAAVGRLTHRMLRAGFGAEYDDKTTADGLILDANFTVIHSGPLNDKEGTAFEAVPLAATRRRFFPHFVSRAGVAQLMLDEAESRRHPGEILIPRPVRSAS